MIIFCNACLTTNDHKLTPIWHLWQPFESWNKVRNTKAQPGELNSENGKPVSGTAVNIYTSLYRRFLSLDKKLYNVQLYIQ